MPNLDKIGPVVLEKKILKFCFSVIISTWKRTWSSTWIKLNSHYPRMLCAKFGRNWPTVLKILSMSFCYFVIISPLKRSWPLILTNLNCLYSRMLCAKYGRNWPRGSGKENENKLSRLLNKTLRINMILAFWILRSPKWLRWPITMGWHPS